jgi:hypothetical protein
MSLQYPVKNPSEFETMKSFFLVLSIYAAMSGFTSAQTMDHSKMKHGNGPAMEMAAGLPTEPGQSAFSAIQEIVVLLEADPKTDWSKVNLEALRQHLIDMNNVALGADVKTDNSGNVVIYTISGEGRVRDSIQRMLKAHADTMKGVDGWGYAAEMTDTGTIFNVTPPDEAAAERLAGLGFIGVMARGMPITQAIVQTILHVGLKFGQAEIADDSLERLLRRKPYSVKDYVRDHKELWNPSSSNAL